MKKPLLHLLIVIITFWCACSTSSAITVYTIGDSTMADYDPNTYSNQRGWAQMLKQFLTGDINHINAARNGRSSKSFYNEGLWNNVAKDVKAGDYVFIQFGHNDEKDDGIAGPNGVGTDPWGQYQDYLKKYVNETRNKGGIPILITPVVRCYFSGNSITYKGMHNLSATEDSLLNYPRAMKAIARELNVPLIDHTTLTKELVESYGQTEAKAVIYAESDNTHLSIVGATLFARLAVQELINKNILTEHLNSSPDVLVNPTSIDFGNCYVSTSSTKLLNISAMSLSPSEGSVTLEASEGFSIGLTANGTFENKIEITYTKGNIPLSDVYVRFSPTESKKYTGTVVVTSSGDPKTVSLTGTALSLAGGITSTVHYPLTDNDQATVTGAIISLGESWSGMYVKNYANPSGTTTWPEGVTAGKAQRNLIEGDAWPGSEIDIVTNRYIQFAVQAPDNGTFTIDSIGVYVGAAGGNGMGYRVMMSTDATFNNATVLEDRPSNVSNTMVALSYKPIYQVEKSETFYLRIYPWYSSAATSKYICLQNLTIQGQVNINNVGVEDIQSGSSINVYPNPSKGVFNIKSLSTDSNLVLYNTLGGKIEKGLSSENTIDLTGYPKGIYLLNISNNEKTETIRLIKE